MNTVNLELAVALSKKSSRFLFYVYIRAIYYQVAIKEGVLSSAATSVSCGFMLLAPFVFIWLYIDFT